MENILRNFNVQLNNSDMDRQLKWKEYRDQITRFIKVNLTSERYEKLLILGAGNCDDIDLERLSGFCASITLADIDYNAMQRAVEKYRLERKSTTLVEIDFTGLDKSPEWNDFINRILLCKSDRDIESLFDVMRDKIRKAEFPFRNDFDIVIVSPIYTQLLLPQATGYLNILKQLDFNSKFLKTVETQLMDLVAYSIEILNGNIKLIAENSLDVFIISDILEAKTNSEFHRKMVALGSDSEIEAFYKQYVNEYGVGAGDYGLEDFSDEVKPDKSAWLKWNFSPDRMIFTKIANYKR